MNIYQDIKLLNQFKRIIEKNGFNYLQACNYADNSKKYSSIPYHLIEKMLEELENKEKLEKDKFYNQPLFNIAR